MLVAYGNSSASGFNAQCACAPVSFGKLSQNELEEKCLQMKVRKSAALTGLEGKILC